MFVPEIPGTCHGSGEGCLLRLGVGASVFSGLVRPSPVSPVYSSVYVGETLERSFPLLLAPVPPGIEAFPGAHGS